MRAFPLRLLLVAAAVATLAIAALTHQRIRTFAARARGSGATEPSPHASDVIQKICSIRTIQGNSNEGLALHRGACVLGPPEVGQWEVTPDGLHARVLNAPVHGPTRRADLFLPQTSDGAMKLADVSSGLSVRVLLTEASSSQSETAGGYVVYPAGHRSGGDIIHRPMAVGTEDFFYFNRPPTHSQVSYQIFLDTRVEGLRLINGTLEMLDSRGIPRLRLRRPRILDANGRTVDASVKLTDCAADINPRAPQGRPVTRPGSTRCSVQVAWNPGIAYPAILDPTWTTTGSMVDAVQKFSATLLPNGMVLVAGGLTAMGSTAHAELFDPVAQVWTSTNNLSTARHNHTATFLALQTIGGNHRVLVAGGESFDGMSTTHLSSSELYDPDSGTWMNTAGGLTIPRANHTATELPNGLVLVAGGRRGSPAVELTSCELFDPQVNRWSSIGGMFQGRFGHSATLVAIPNEYWLQVLVAGGMQGDNRALATAELFDPLNRSWRLLPGNLSSGRAFHSTQLLANGKILVVGGVDYGFSPPLYPTGAELFDPATRMWSSGGTLSQGRAGLVTLLLANAGIVAAGGFNGPSSDNDTNIVELYDEATNVWTLTTPMVAPRSFFMATALRDRSVVVEGGSSGSMTPTASAEQFLLGSFGDSCSANVECADRTCSGGTCGCPDQQRNCPALNRCVPNNQCCVGSECTSPRDSCHVAAGASCVSGLCFYQPLACPGQACVAGSCIDSPVTLTVTPSSTQFANQPSMFINGQVRFRATLTNTTSTPISVSLFDAGNIAISAFARAGTSLTPEVLPAAVGEDPMAVASSQLMTIPSSQSRQFDIMTASTLNSQTRPYSTMSYFPAGPGTYTITFIYQYSGPDGDFVNVFHGIITSNEVTFNVQ